MLNRPPLNQLMNYVDSKYTLVVVAAKRARLSMETNADDLHINKINPVSAALEEVAQGSLIWQRIKELPK